MMPHQKGEKVVYTSYTPPMFGGLMAIHKGAP